MKHSRTPLTKTTGGTAYISLVLVWVRGTASHIEATFIQEFITIIRTHKLKREGTGHIDELIQLGS